MSETIATGMRHAKMTPVDHQSEMAYINNARAYENKANWRGAKWRISEQHEYKHGGSQVFSEWNVYFPIVNKWGRYSSWNPNKSWCVSKQSSFIVIFLDKVSGNVLNLWGLLRDLWARLRLLWMVSSTLSVYLYWILSLSDCDVDIWLMFLFLRLNELGWGAQL